jgi:hypothetical protein
MPAPVKSTATVFRIERTTAIQHICVYTDINHFDQFKQKKPRVLRGLS